MKVTCENCKIVFNKHKSQIKVRSHNFCSKDCYNSKRKGSGIECRHCNSIFYYGRLHRRGSVFCSVKCQSENSKKVKEFKCKNCGKTFEDRPSRKRRFCSKTCYFSYDKRKARPLVKTCKYCRSKYETKRKRSKFCSTECSYSWLSGVRNIGKNHPRYKGLSKSRKKYPRQFYLNRPLVIKRDINCKICASKASSVHHIDYDIENNDLTNLVLLCFSCHAKTNSNREQWELYFKKEMFIKNKR